MIRNSGDRDEPTLGGRAWLLEKEHSCKLILNMIPIIRAGNHAFRRMIADQTGRDVDAWKILEICWYTVLSQHNFTYLTVSIVIHPVTLFI